MSIQTTINIDKSYLYKLTMIGDKYAISRSRLLALLINTFFQHQPLLSVMFRTVRYQKRQPKNRWEIIHVSFSDDLFEKCGDVRNCCKFSVSLLIAKAISLYLDTIEKELANGKEENNENKTDNYLNTYVCICNSKQENTNFHIYWGKTRE